MNTINNKLRNISIITVAKYLIIIEPLLMVWSFALSNLNISLITLIGLYITFKKKYFLEKKISIIFFSFWIIIVAISFFSEHSIFSLKSSLFFARYYFVIIVFHYAILSDNEFIKKFFWTILLLSLFLIFDALTQSIIGFNIFGYPSASIENLRISGMFGDELILGKFLLNLFFIILALKIKTNLKSKFFNILIPIIFFIAITTTGERTSSILFVFGFGCILVLPRIFTIKEKLILALMTLSAFLILSTQSERFQKRMLSTTIGELKNSEFLMASIGHEKHYRLAFEIFKNNKIFGIGPNNFRKECSKNLYQNNVNYSCSTHPHNFYIQILAETGIVGITFAIFFLYKILSFLILNIIRKDPVLICLGVGLLVNFFPFAPSGNFFGSWLLNLNILTLAFVNINKT